MKKRIKIYSDNDFIVSQCATVDIPGYLIIETKQNVQYLHRKQFTAWWTLGELMAKIEKELYRIVKPENVYFAKFGEECKKVHFHIFPRTKEITERYLTQHPDTKNINGPQIFDWARKEYKVDEGCLSDETISITRSIWIKKGI